MQLNLRVLETNTQSKQDKCSGPDYDCSEASLTTLMTLFMTLLNGDSVVCVCMQMLSQRGRNAIVTVMDCLS